MGDHYTAAYTMLPRRCAAALKKLGMSEKDTQEADMFIRLWVVPTSTLLVTTSRRWNGHHKQTLNS